MSDTDAPIAQVLPRRARTRAPATQANLLRVWAAARKDGKEVVRTKVWCDGSIDLFHKSEASLAPAEEALEAWKARRDAHSS
jgi:hypothetical protein